MFGVECEQQSVTNHVIPPVLNLRIYSFSLPRIMIRGTWTRPRVHSVCGMYDLPRVWKQPSAFVSDPKIKQGWSFSLWFKSCYYLIALSHYLRLLIQFGLSGSHPSSRCRQIICQEVKFRTAALLNTVMKGVFYINWTPVLYLGWIIVTCGNVCL